MGSYKTLLPTFGQVCLLNVPVVLIGRHSSFFELGGDSITAIQVSSKCKGLGIVVATSDMFQKTSLRELALTVTDVSVAKVAETFITR